MGQSIDGDARQVAYCVAENRYIMRIHVGALVSKAARRFYQA